MPARDVEAVFYVKKEPIFELREGMVHVCHAQAEFVMRPNIFLKALRAANRCADEFHETAAGIVGFKRKSDTH